MFKIYDTTIVSYWSHWYNLVLYLVMCHMSADLYDILLWPNKYSIQFWKYMVYVKYYYIFAFNMISHLRENTYCDYRRCETRNYLGHMLNVAEHIMTFITSFSQ